MTALAPGADSLVAEVVFGEDDELEYPHEFKKLDIKLDIHVRAPLPFPHNLYRLASTYVRNDPPNDEDRQRQEVFDQLLEKIGPENSFPVMLESDYALTTDQQNDEFRRNVDDRADRNQRCRRRVQRQLRGAWAMTAREDKRRLATARIWVLGLSVTAAAFGMIAQHLSSWELVIPAQIVSGLSVVCLLCTPYLTLKLLGPERVRSWTRARSLAESLKREFFLARAIAFRTRPSHCASESRRWSTWAEKNVPVPDGFRIGSKPRGTP